MCFYNTANPSALVRDSFLLWSCFLELSLISSLSTSLWFLLSLPYSHTDTEVPSVFGFFHCFPSSGSGFVSGQRGRICLLPITSCCKLPAQALSYDAPSTHIHLLFPSVFPTVRMYIICIHDLSNLSTAQSSELLTSNDISFWAAQGTHSHWLQLPLKMSAIWNKYQNVFLHASLWLELTGFHFIQVYWPV